MNHNTRNLRLAAFAVAVLSASSSASAAVVTYTNLNTWKTATPNWVQATQFANATQGQPLSQASSLTMGSQSLVNLNGFTDSLDGNTGGGYPSLNAATSGSLTVQAGSTVYAAMLYLGTNNAGGQILVTLSTGDSFTIQTTGSGPVLWGFTSSQQVKWITVAPVTAGQTADVADFYTGAFAADTTTTTTATPEVATILTVGSGLIFLGARRKNRQGTNGLVSSSV